MIKVYVNNSSTFHNEYDYVLIADTDSIIDDNNSISGCAIRCKDPDKIGYLREWSKTFFRELREDEEVSININSKKSNGVKILGNKILVRSEKMSSNYLKREDCIIDMGKGELIVEDIKNYLIENPLKVKLVSKGGRKGLKLFNQFVGESIVISDKTTSGRIKGCILNNRFDLFGYLSLDKSKYVEVNRNESLEIVFNNECMDIIGGKLLIKSISFGEDCIIDMKNGKIEKVNLSKYRKNNPFLITLKNKISKSV